MMFPLPFAICAILAPIATIASAAAFPWSLPEPTRFAAAIDNWSPAPTPAPRFGNVLFAREAIGNTCGYVSGLAESSITCPNTADVCATNSFYGVHGCCNPASVSSGSCTIATTCIPSSALSTACASSCTSDPAILKCTASSAPECYQQLIVYPTTTMIQHGCAAHKYTSTAYRTPGLTSSVAPEQLVTVTVTTGPSNTATSPPSASAKSTQLGPIIGGTVAGCVVISCILLALFIIRRRRRHRAAPPSTTPALPTPAVEAPSPFPPHAVTEYNPHGFAPYAHPQDTKAWPRGAVWRPETQQYAVEVDGSDGRVEAPG